MTPSAKFLICLLFVGVICLFGCNSQEAEQPPSQQGEVVDKEQTHASPVLDTQTLPAIDDNNTVPEDAEAIAEPVKMRFEPVRNPRGVVVMAERERQRTGFRNSDDFTLPEAIQIGELLRKEWSKLSPLDERVLRSQGIRIIKGKHLTLCTDLPPSPEIDRLPEIFDRAVPEYCHFFGVDPQHVNAWQMRGCLIDDLEKFRAVDLLGTFPTHLNGYSVEDRLWVLEQKSDYFRRHLILHEGVHGFMNNVFGTCGQDWYMESTAEYLATHRWENGRLELGIMPENTDAVMGWRRIEMVRADIKAGKIKTVDRIIRLPVRQDEPPTDYAWVWCFGFLLDNHPQYRETYRDMAKWLTFADFSNRFYLQLADHWGELQIEWLGLLDELQYGYDVPRIVIEQQEPPLGQPLTSSMAFDVDASRGWQNSGVALEMGQTYRITANGQYQLGDSPKVWYAEPNGVTFRYHKGQPVGLLIGAVVPIGLFDTDEEIPPKSVPFLSPILIGTGIELTPQQSGILYLRINDSPAELGDNKGTCRVEIEN